MADHPGRDGSWAKLEIRQLSKTFLTRTGFGRERRVAALDGVSLSIRPGEFVTVIGPSGCGKSTLLMLVAGLERTTRGEIVLDGRVYSALDAEALAALRNRRIGFVFQYHHLLREFSALENVMMPLLVGDWAPEAARSRAEQLLAEVGLAGRMTHRPAALSGGEQQRCAVARALVHDPDLVLADEPTGNLDHANGAMVADLFFRLARELETAVVIVTHNRLLAARADRVLLLEGGRLSPVNEVEALH